MLEDFVEYFASEYFNKRSGWYEGVAPGYPSTNNGLESINNQIKATGTFRKRLPLNQFIDVMFRLVEEWSMERQPESINCKTFNKTPTYSLPLQTEAEKWIKKRMELRVRRQTEDLFHYFIPASGTNSLKRRN